MFKGRLLLRHDEEKPHNIDSRTSARDEGSKPSEGGKKDHT